MKKKIFEIAVLFTVMIGIYMINHFLDFKMPADYPAGITYARAKVIAVLENNLGNDPEHKEIEIGKQKLRMVITDGPYKGKEIDVYNFVERSLQQKGEIGARYIVASYDEFITVLVISYDRIQIVTMCTFIFLLIVVIFGKWKGIKSIFSLAFTLLCVFYLLIPLILKGVNPILAAVTVVVLSTCVTFYSISGISKKSILASACCMICCLIAGLYGYAFSHFMRVSTLNTPEAENLLFITEGTGLRIQNMLVAGIIVASMGAIMDTSMSMISSLQELKEVNPQITGRQLVKSGFRIGSDIMGTMTNTLILAFAGGSINMLMTMFMYQSPLIALINSDLIVIELLRGLSGSVAVVCAIPVSIFLASVTDSYRK